MTMSTLISAMVVMLCSFMYNPTTDVGPHSIDTYLLPMILERASSHRHDRFVVATTVRNR